MYHTTCTQDVVITAFVKCDIIGQSLSAPWTHGNSMKKYPKIETLPYAQGTTFKYINQLLCAQIFNNVL